MSKAYGPILSNNINNVAVTNIAYIQNEHVQYIQLKKDLTAQLITQTTEYSIEAIQEI